MPSHIPRVPVQSSNVRSVGYDAASRTLAVEFAGAVYHYHNVPAEVHRDLMAADSKGRYLRASVVGKFPYEKVP